jgi:hypothetical protein
MAKAIRPYNNIIAAMVGAHRVRPKSNIDISTKLRCSLHSFIQQHQQQKN